MEIRDVSGEPRPDDEIEAALLWVKKRIIRPNYADPEGVIYCVTIKDALQELMSFRRAAQVPKSTPESKQR